MQASNAPNLARDSCAATVIVARSPALYLVGTVSSKWKGNSNADIKLLRIATSILWISNAKSQRNVIYPLVAIGLLSIAGRIQLKHIVLDLATLVSIVDILAP